MSKIDATYNNVDDVTVEKALNAVDSGRTYARQDRYKSDVVFKIAKKVTGTLVKDANSTQGQLVLTHSLGYTPVVICSFTSGGTPYRLLPYTMVVSSSGLVRQHIYVDGVTSVNLLINWDTPNIAGGDYANDFSETVIAYCLKETL